MFDASLLESALELFAKSKRLCCLCHQNPDGDALGSLAAMAELLTAQYPTIPVLLYCKDVAPSSFAFIPSLARLQPLTEVREGDVFIFLDSAEPKLTGYLEDYPDIFTGKWPSLCIDHHPANPKFGQLNIIIGTASSTCEIVTNLADALQWTITPSIATSLMTGLYTDTGSLLHSNATARVYRTAARLLRSGAKRQVMVESVFRTAKLSTLRLWGRVLEKISLSDEGGAVSAITEGDFRASGADYSELTGAIDYVNAIPGMRFSLILAEKDGKVKGSLRTLRDDVDVSKMASAFQGGGHKKAAGFALSGKLAQETRWKVEKS
jgi:phosphoesterase RecJ-like protein